MKQCSVCDKDLPAQIDEFGDMFYPMCMSCFLSGYQPIVYIDEKIDEMKEYIQRSNDDIAGFRSKQSDLYYDIQNAEREIRSLSLSIEDEKKNADDIEYLEWDINDYESEQGSLSKEIEEYEAARNDAEKTLKQLEEMKRKIFSNEIDKKNQLELSMAVTE